MSSDSHALRPWKIKSKSTVLDTKWFKIVKQQMQTADGAPAEYFIHDTNDSVICVCITQDNRVLIEYQYRPPLERVSIDYPAGRVEKDDATTEDAIRRELAEEAGVVVSSLQKLAVVDRDPGFTKTRLHIYLARGEVTKQAAPEETESIVVKFVEPRDILRMLASGEMSCAYCVAATFFAFQEIGLLTSL